MPQLALRAISDHHTVTGDTVTSWYRLPAVGWDFRSQEDRERLIHGHGTGLAALTGHRLHYRVVWEPRSPAQWARAHDKTAPEPLPGWSDHLRATQVGMAVKPLHRKVVYVGISLETDSLTARVANNARALAGVLAPGRSTAATLRAVREAAAKVDAVMTSHSVGATAATPSEIGRLVRQSVGLGLPMPDPWTIETGDIDETDLAACTTGITHSPEPFGRAVGITGTGNDGEPVTLHVTVAAIGRMVDMDIPERQPPWLQRLDALGIPYQVSMRAEIVSPTTTAGEFRKSITKIHSQVKHYSQEHGEDPPAELASQRTRALAAERELTESLSGAGIRVRTWPHIATWGATPDVALKRQKAIRDALQNVIEIHAVPDQAAAIAAFVPGQPAAARVHTRRMSVTGLAASVPWATSVWGDESGTHMGHTSGTSSAPACLDMWAATEHARSGLVLYSAGLGGGKSTLMGWQIYNSAMAGVECDVLDPSGRLQSLGTLPELSDRLRVVDLLDGEDGILSPYGVVPDPDRRHFDDEAYQRRLTKARRDRQSLATSIIQQLLPPALASDALTEIAVLQAVARVEPVRSAALASVVDELAACAPDDDADLGRHARRIAGVLREIAETSTGKLLFPAAPPAWGTVSRPGTITVYSMRGLSLPDDRASASEHTQIETRLGLCVLSSAAWLVMHKMYWGAHDQRKLIAMDEVRVLRRTHTGRALMESASADSRKHNTVVLLADQQPAALVDLGLANLSDMAFMGSLTDPEQQTAACKLLKIPRGVGYEAVFANIRTGDKEPRQFIGRDWKGRVERITADMTYRADVIDALSTTSDASRLSERMRDDDAVSLPYEATEMASA